MASAQRTVAMVVLGLLAGALVLAAVILLARGDGNAPIEVLLPTPEATSSSPLPSNGTPSTSSQSDTELRVHLSGAVQTLAYTGCGPAIGWWMPWPPPVGLLPTPTWWRLT